MIIIKYTLIIEGMSCRHCQARVEEALKALPGVKKVKADFSKGLASFEAAGIEQGTVFAAVEEAGYTPVTMKGA